MKIALSNRGKLGLLVGIPIMLGLAVAFYLTFSRSALQADYDKIQIGMSASEADSFLVMEKNRAHLGGDPFYLQIYVQPDSPVIPGSRICLTIDLQDRVIKKEIERPSLGRIWNHWMNQLGL